jgi:hypothetical protein
VFVGFFGDMPAVLALTGAGAAQATAGAVQERGQALIGPDQTALRAAPSPALPESCGNASHQERSTTENNPSGARTGLSVANLTEGLNGREASLLQARIDGHETHA